MKTSQALEALKTSSRIESKELETTILELHKQKLEHIEQYIKSTYKHELNDIRNDIVNLEEVMKKSHILLKKEIKTTWIQRLLNKMK